MIDPSVGAAKLDRPLGFASAHDHYEIREPVPSPTAEPDLVIAEA